MSLFVQTLDSRQVARIVGSMETTKPIIPKLSALTLPWPTDWAAVFGVERPLILDIGFGYGHTLTHLSHKHPDHNIVGLEIANFCLERAEKIIPRDGLFNVRAVYAHAETALHHLFTPGSLQQIHVNFPDPWFKERHAGRRLMQRDTLDAMVSRLAPGGMLYVATDIRDYAEMSHELLADTPGLTNTLDTPWVSELAGRTITKYERKAIEAGRPRHFFAYQRNDQPAPEIPVIEEWEMPHIVIETPLDMDTIRREFSQQSYAHDDIRVKVMRVFRGDESLLFEAYVAEPTVEQQIALVFAGRRGYENQYALKLGFIGNPRPTAGVHVAVRKLGEWLLSLHPDNVMVEDKVKQRL